MPVVGTVLLIPTLSMVLFTVGVSPDINWQTLITRHLKSSFELFIHSWCDGVSGNKSKSK